ncbi:hypothetical protein VTJ49DRAFT_3749 [Mycothermus thermophilus]|uniref:Uncharacterized protein n=1 Tax=Humicola insolens TaxID=85995 RepID=A0ABR3V6S9_HUMIN
MSLQATLRLKFSLGLQRGRRQDCSSYIEKIAPDPLPPGDGENAAQDKSCPVMVGRVDPAIPCPHRADD